VERSLSPVTFALKVHSTGRVGNKFQCQYDPSSSPSVHHEDHGRGEDDSPGNFTKPPALGMVFPSFEELAAYVYNWGRVNSSLLVSGGFQRNSLQHRGFHCPHKMSNWRLKKRGNGKKKFKRMLEYADCPFAIRITGRQADGSYVITKADLEHKGHEVSVDHFQRHSKRGMISQRGVLKPKLDQVEHGTMSKDTEVPKFESDSTGKKEEEDKIDVNNEQEEALRLPLANGGNHTEHTNNTKSTYDVDKEENMDDNENKMLLKVSSVLEDEIGLDEMPQEKKKKPKKLIFTKDRHNFFNFFNMKEKERKELEEKEKSKKVRSKEEEKKEREKKVAAEKLKDVFKLIW